MPLFSNVLAGAAGQGGGVDGYVIPKSLRFSATNTSYLSRTPSTAGSQTTWSWSCWLKLTGTGNHQLFGEDGGYPNSSAFFQSDGTIRFTAALPSSSVHLNLVTTQAFRDYSAWYHIVCVLDTTNSTTADRARIYVNGTRVTDFSTAVYPSQNATTIFNAANNEMRIGTHSGVNYFEGFMADIQFVDGQALQASDFGEARSSDGVWVAKEYDGTYGTNGFHLNFSDSSSNEALGLDKQSLPDLDPKKGFDVLTYAGNGAITNHGGVLFEPGLVWLKTRSGHNGKSHTLFDTVRGPFKFLATNETSGENDSYDNNLEAFNPDGFRIGEEADVNTGGRNYVAWMWAAGGIAVPNTDGSITSSVSANVDYGFSIVTWSGSGAAATVGHGLSAAPKLIIIKNRSASYNWAVGTDAIGWTEYLYLSTGDAKAASQAVWNDTAPTSSVFSVKNSSASNRSGDDMVAYCWNEVSGYSKFSTYSGTGSSHHVTCGFRPAYVIVKCTTSSNTNWHIFDKERGSERLIANTANDGGTPAAYAPTFTDTGFTVANVSDTHTNASGQTYLFAAFADRPGNHFDVHNIVTNEGLAASKSQFDVVLYTGNGATQQVGGPVYSDTSTLSNAEGAFDGSTSTGGVFNSTGNSILTASSITITSSLEIFHNRTGSLGITVNINGTNYTATGLSSNGYHTIPIPNSDLPLTSTGSITIKDNQSGAQSTVYAVRVDNNVLRDNTGNPLNFKPDLVWLKSRSDAYSHSLYDSVRGTTKSIESNGSGAESTVSSGLTSFNTDGFTIGSEAQINNTGRTFVAWCWKANGTAVSNTNGSITSSVSANVDYGFSIVSYTGNGTAGATIGHGLSKPPVLVIYKNRDRAESWGVYAKDVGASKSLYINSTTQALNANSGSANMYNSTDPTDTVLTVGNAAHVNANGEKIIAYCFANVPGHQRVGSYIGHGQYGSPKVVTGFRPRFLLIKSISSTNGWFMWDSERDSTNPNDALFSANASNAEQSASNHSINFNDDGFTPDDSNSAFNSNGVEYLYWAIGDDEIGFDEDCLVDVPNAVAADGDATDTTGGYQRGNYATLNPLVSGSNVTLSNGGLHAVSGGGGGGSARAAYSTIAVDVSQKWYCEVLVGSTNVLVGIIQADNYTVTGYPGETAYGYGYYDNGQKYNNGSGSSYGASFTTGDLIGIRIDNGSLIFYKNGVSQGAAYTGLTGLYFIGFGSYGNTVTFNFGQQRFKYPIPAGHSAVNTTALPAATIADGSKYFDAVTYTSDGQSTKKLTFDFSPDLFWSKVRNFNEHHVLHDSVRGTSKVIKSSTSAAESTESSGRGVLSFDSDGVTIGTGSPYNSSGNNSVVWAWAAGSSTVSNTDGSITSSVRANASAGISIVSWTGTGANATVGHGLNAQPDLLLVKNRDATASWAVWHTALTGSQFLGLNTTNAIQSSANYWNSTVPTSSVFSVGSDSSANGSSNNMIAYCFTSIPGFSMVGSYEGTGSYDTAPFIFCGFKPRWIMMKNADTGGTYYDWRIIDSARHTYNEGGNGDFPPTLFANRSSSEVDWDNVDILSNGFKIRDSSVSLNQSGATNVFVAFAENPFSANGGLAR